MNHLKNIGLWLLYFVPAILIELVCYILAPLVAIFVTTWHRDDYVKRIGRSASISRSFIIKPLYWFQTHDNAVDEWWYGMYNVDHWFKFAREWTQADYDGSRLIRYYCRLMWLWRNCAYGFHYALFSRSKESVANVWVTGDEDAGYWHQLQVFQSSFQLEVHIPHVPLRVIGLVGLLGCAIFFNTSPFMAFLFGTINYVFYAVIEGRYLSINIGWKAHKKTERLLYANRLISFRKYQ